MSCGERFPCELLPWDTEFFGRRMARVCGNRLDDDLADRIDRWSREQRVEGLYLLAVADDPQTIRVAEARRFHFVDIRMTFRWSAPESAAGRALSGPESRVRIRDFEPGDLPSLRRIARSSYGDTRFFSDPHFDRRRAEDLYETWITLECQGRANHVLVASAGGAEAIGYITCHLNAREQEGMIGLVGVDEAMRGQGAGQALVSSALGWFMAQGLRQVSVVTQGKNLAAQRLYQRSGFVTAQVELWYHKWYEPAEPAVRAGSSVQPS